MDANTGKYQIKYGQKIVYEKVTSKENAKNDFALLSTYYKGEVKKGKIVKNAKRFSVWSFLLITIIVLLSSLFSYSDNLAKLISNNNTANGIFYVVIFILSVVVFTLKILGIFGSDTLNYLHFTRAVVETLTNATEKDVVSKKYTSNNLKDIFLEATTSLYAIWVIFQAMYDINFRFYTYGIMLALSVYSLICSRKKEIPLIYIYIFIAFYLISAGFIIFMVGINLFQGEMVMKIPTL